MNEINTNMIVLARESRGWVQKDLGERIDMSAPNLSKIERSEIGISEKMLEQIATATGYPIQFFYQAGGTVSQNLAYRKRKRVPQKLMTPIDARANIFMRHVQFLTRILNVAPPTLPSWEVTEVNPPQKLAERFRSKMELDIKEVKLLKLIEQQAIPVMAFDFATERVDSFTMLTEDKYPIIFINSILRGDRRRFTIAYELGQLIMHSGKSINPERDIKQEANHFAATLLMPEKEISKDFKQQITIPLLAELKRKWKVSMIALLHRADDLGFLTPNQKRYLLEQFNILGIRRREPAEYDLPVEQPSLVRKWLSAYRSKQKLNIIETSATLCLNADEYIELYS